MQTHFRSVFIPFHVHFFHVHKLVPLSSGSIAGECLPMFTSNFYRQRNHSGEKPIIAVVRGRQEFGPRALGHRSLLAVPDSHEMRERMNRLKARQWYRPVAPMIAEDELPRYVECGKRI